MSMPRGANGRHASVAIRGMKVVFIRKLRPAAAFDNQHLRAADAFGRRHVHTARLDAEDVVGQVEGDHLAAAIVRLPIGAQGAGHDLLENFCRLVFAVDFGIAGKAYRRAQGRSPKYKPGGLCGLAAILRGIHPLEPSQGGPTKAGRLQANAKMDLSL
jgi:hypothetical protein